jgi:hypothetical protein
MLLDREWDGPRRLWARAYVLLVVALFLLFLPVLLGLAVPSRVFFGQWALRFKPWSWFRSWI